VNDARREALARPTTCNFRLRKVRLELRNGRQMRQSFVLRSALASAFGSKHPTPSEPMLPGDTSGERNIFKLYAITRRASTPPPYGMTHIVELNMLDQRESPAGQHFATRQTCGLKDDIEVNNNYEAQRKEFIYKAVTERRKRLHQLPPTIIPHCSSNSTLVFKPPLNHHPAARSNLPSICDTQFRRQSVLESCQSCSLVAMAIQ
jgi:hypothetical protein